MFISKLQLKNFKRFSDLTIELPPNRRSSESNGEPPKLVLLIGANGSGKSCVFDAFEFCQSLYSEAAGLSGINGNKGIINFVDPPFYYKKHLFEPTFISLNGSSGEYLYKERQSKVIAEVTQENSKYKLEEFRKENKCAYKFYGRTAFRYLPRLDKPTIGQIKEETIAQNLDRPKTYIDLDFERLENDFDFLVTKTVYEIFNSHIPAQDKLDKLNNLLSEINSALERIFGDDNKTSLRFQEFRTPSSGEPAKLLFKKGNSVIHYDLLSAGEKEVINVIFDLYVRKSYFMDAIYFMDELDLHLNTSLQEKLLKEITENWIPENSQIWVASHSLGFIKYAREYNKGTIIDFDNLDFDIPQILEPNKDNLMVYEIAVPQETLAILFKDKQKIYCENQNDEYYNLLGLENKVFLPEIDKNAVFVRLENNRQIDTLGIIDRDYLSDQERNSLMNKFPNIKVLEYYCFENYIWHPDNIVEVLPAFDREAYIETLIQLKNKENDNIKASLAKSRDSYVFFRKHKNLKDENLDNIFKLLNSNDLKDFYKVFPMKNKGNLANINIAKSRLVKTKWFKAQIEEVLK